MKYKLFRNQVYLNLSGSKETIHLLKDPQLYPVVLESEISGRLGYFPVREQKDEIRAVTGYDSNEALQRHLKNMDDVVEENNPCLGLMCYVISETLEKAITEINRFTLILSNEERFKLKKELMSIRSLL